MHPAQLAGSFRKQVGVPVGDYIRRLRVEFAIDQLSSSSIPLADLALAAGFCDHSHFCHVFKNETGTTPAQFRAAVRGK
jgi:AraC family transcriptional regulator